MVGIGGLYRLLDWEAEPDTSGPRGGQLEALAGVRITDLRICTTSYLFYDAQKRPSAGLMSLRRFFV
jgi:hypothetical protein